MTLPAAAQKVLAALVAAGGVAGAGDLARATGLGSTSVSGATRALRQAGLIAPAGGAKGRWKLTSSGQVSVLSADPVSAGSVVDDALALWAEAGLYPHRAALELLLSTIVARHHGDRSRDDPYLVFMAAGETNTGKSSFADVARGVFGLDKTRHRRMLPTMSRGAVQGRYEPVEGGGRRLVPSPIASLPLVILDEFDKAPTSTREAVWPYFDGDVKVTDEDGEVRLLLPTPVLTTNVPLTGDRYRQIPREYRRRAVLLDTAYAADRSEDVEKVMEQWEASTPTRAVLRLADFSIPTNVLPRDAMEVLRVARAQALTKAGRAQCPPKRALAAAALGRAALAGDFTEDGLVLAAFSVAVAYLTVTETVPGEVDPGWSLPMAEVRKYLNGHRGVDDLERVYLASRQAQEQARAAASRASVAVEIEAGDLLGQRHRLAERLSQASKALERGKVPKEYQERSQPLREQLDWWRKKVLDAGTQAALENYDQAVQPVHAQAVELRRWLDAEKARLVREVADAKADNERDRRIAATAKRQENERRVLDERERKGRLKKRLEDLRARIATGENLWKRKQVTTGEQPPWRTLESLQLLRYERGPRTGVGGSLLRLVAATSGDLSVLETDFWVCTIDERIRFPASPTSCSALADWGEGTRLVLWPWLVAAHREEDDLLAAGGWSLRRSRPELYRPRLSEALPPAQRLALPPA